MRLAVSAVLFCLLPAALAQPQPATQNGETRAARALEQARRQGPLALYAFFEHMPKGAASLKLCLSLRLQAEGPVRSATAHKQQTSV